MQSIGDQAVSETGTSWPFAADYLASLENTRAEPAQPEPEAPAPRAPDPRPSRPGRGFEGADRSEPAQRIAESLCDIDRLTSAIEAYRLGNGPLAAPVDVAPASTLQATLLNIWKRVLGRPRIGMNDNFFEVGGTSLRAVQMIATIKKELKQDLNGPQRRAAHLEEVVVHSDAR